MSFENWDKADRLRRPRRDPELEHAIANGAETIPDEIRFATRHGEFERKADVGAALAFSRMGSGMSLIRVEPPSLHYVLSGEELYTVDGRTRRVRAGEFILISPHQEFVGRNNRESVGFCVYLADAERAAVFEPELNVPALLGTALDPLSLLLGSQARSLLEGSPSLPTGEFLALMEHSVNAFAGRMTDSSDQLSQARPATRIEILHRLERVRSYLHDHQDVAVSLATLEREACLSRYQLVRSFAEVYGQSPISYHRGLRLAWAARRLAEGSATPTELTLELGYGSLSAFSRAFRTRFGRPPTTFVAK